MTHRVLRAVALTLSSLVVMGLSSPASGDPGSLDPNFGHGGIVTTDFPHAFDLYATSVAVQRDGKIVVGGFAKLVGPKQVFALARYRTYGHLDQTFSGDGRVTSSAGYLANDVVIASSGKILEGGFTKDGDFVIVRYRSDGSLNSSFGDHGKVVTDICGSRCLDEINALAIDGRGRIVAAGHAGNELALARYLPGGSLDDTFGDHGVMTSDLGGVLASAADVALEPNGKIVIAGESSGGDFALARFGLNGAPDDSFGDHGLVTTDFGPDSEDSAEALAIRKKGKIVVVGSSGCASCSNTKFEFAVARYEPGGAPDMTFAGDGTTTTSIGPGSDRAWAVVTQRNGKIVVAGGAGCHVELARYTPDGTLDPAFGIAGTVRTDMGGCATANDIARVGINKVVIAGPAGSLFGVAKYQAG